MRAYKRPNDTSIHSVAKILPVLFAVFLALPAYGQTRLDTGIIEQQTKLKGAYIEDEGVYKITMPRSDLNVMTKDVKLTPPLGIGSWVAFKKTGDKALVTGDLALTEEEVKPVMKTVLENGFQVTALHNHFLSETPRIMFMHISGAGTEAQLSTGVDKILSKVKEAAQTPAQTQPQTPQKPAAPAIDPAATALSPQIIENILGTKGELKDGVYKVTLKVVKTDMGGARLGAGMGLGTTASFAGSDAKAVAGGDFVVHEKELQAVLKSLTGSNITVTAIHNHLIGEDPRVVFLHFWGIGSTIDLANGLKAALAAEEKAAKGGA